MPTAFGVPWADSSHLTLSFTPTGTATPTGSSNLTGLVAGTGSNDAWMREILRAFQTWSVNANINIGLVADGGQALGTQGAVQGDSRFGDIRIAAAAIDGSEVAAASPFSWTGTTFAGDVIFDSTRSFQIGNDGLGFDVFSVALHEAGHVFGLDHEEAETALHTGYVFSTGLSAAEVAHLQELYGERTPDRFEGTGGNGTLATASVMPGAITTLGVRLTADGDLTRAGDVDVYKFTTLGVSSLTPVTVRVQAEGLSLVLARVTVYDSQGRVVGSATATDPTNNDLLVRIADSKPGATYFVKVEGATNDVFGIGSYRVVVDTTVLGATLPPLGPVVTSVVDLLSNDTLASATNLLGLQLSSPDSRFDATYRGTVESPRDVDYYKLIAPGSTGTTTNLNAIVWTTGGNLDPRVRVFDSAGNAVAFRVLANDTGLMSIQVENARAGATYYLQVAARNPGGATATGQYFLGVDFSRIAPPAYETVGGGSLGPTATSGTGGLTVERAAIFQFVIGAGPLAPGTGTVTLTVTDSTGAIAFTMTSTAGQPAATTVRYLAAGNYRFTYTYRAVSGQTAGPIGYALAILKLNEGVGPYATKSGSTSPGSGGSSSPPASSPPPSDPSPGTSSPPPSESGYTYTGSSQPASGSYWYSF